MAFNFGSSFSTPSTTTFTFGSGSQSKGFGQSGFGFGTTATTSTAPTFSFGTTTSNAPSIGFGAVTKPSFSAGFNTSTFGSGTTNTGTAFSFTAPTTTTQSLFSGFGQTQTTSSGFGGFGASFGTSSTLGPNTSFNFGQSQQLQQQQPATDPDELLVNSIFKCNIYGDERDQVITKWNLLQGLWGCGKGYYSQNCPPVEYTAESYLSRLKSIVYSVKPKSKPSDALVVISINKRVEEIKNQQSQFESSIANILGNKPNITVHVEWIRPSSDSKSLVLIYVEEKTSATLIRRIPQNEVCSYLLQPSPKQQLISMGVDNVYCYSCPKEEQLAEYLERPPPGIEPKLWKQAQDDNPDPSEFIPVPMIGFENLERHLKGQLYEMKVHDTVVDNLSGEISKLQRRQNVAVARISQYEETLIRLEHRLLKLFVTLSEYPNVAFGPEEEALKARIQSLQSRVTKPQYFKNRVSQMMSTLRLHEIGQSKPDNTIDNDTLKDIKEFLSMQVNAINHLNDMLRTDSANVNDIEKNLTKLPSKD